MTGERVFRPTIECPCDGSLLERRFTYTMPPEGETSFDLGGQEYRRGYDRCAACGHWFGTHDLDLGDLYGGDYVVSTYGDRMAATFERIVALPLESSDNSGRCRRILEFAERRMASTASPTLLDVGSGLGVFPYAMQEAGWRCTALDPDPNACAHIAGRVGVPTINADFLAVAPTVLGTFDVVTFNKVLEHVEDPCLMLRRARQVIAESGFVYVEVPDGDGAAMQGQGREEFFVEHHHVFSVASLSSTVERSGLYVARLDRFKDPSGKFSLACFAIPQIV